MTTVEWFRHESWNSEIALQFETRLARSRSARGEYLRIQAYTLAATRRADNAVPAIELAKRYLSLEPAGFSAAQMYACMACAHETLGDKAAALAAYRCAIALEQKKSGVRGYYYLDFAWFAASHGMCDLYDEVLHAMASNKEDKDLMFPVNQYRFFASLALMSADAGDMSTARQMAGNALQAASLSAGPFAHLPAAGVCVSGSDPHRERLERLAA